MSENESDRVKVTAKYTFTEDEKKELSEKLARGISDLAALEDHKKEMASQIKAEIDETKAAVNRYARHLQAGFEMRDLWCVVIMDYNEGTVSYVREDNGEIVRERRMTPEERQSKMF